MSEIETDAFAPKSPNERPNDDAKFDPLGGGFKRTGSRDKSTAAGDTNTGGDADGVNPAAGLKLASIFAKKAKEAKARMMSDFDQLREGIKKGGLEGGLRRRQAPHREGCARRWSRRRSPGKRLTSRRCTAAGRRFRSRCRRVVRPRGPRGRTRTDQ
jgi:hypothetical protein